MECGVDNVSVEENSGSVCDTLDRNAFPDISKEVCSGTELHGCHTETDQKRISIQQESDLSGTESTTSFGSLSESNLSENTSKTDQVQKQASEKHKRRKSTENQKSNEKKRPYHFSAKTFGRFLSGKKDKSANVGAGLDDDSETERHSDTRGSLDRSCSDQSALSLDRSSSERSRSGSPALLDEHAALTQFECQAMFSHKEGKESGVSEDSVSVDEQSFSTEPASREKEYTVSVNAGPRNTLGAVYALIASILLAGYGLSIWICGRLHSRLKYLLGFTTKQQEQATEEVPAKDDTQNKQEVRVYHIVQELLSTEEAYVARLAILVQAKERATQVLSVEVARDMFRDIQVIHQFHADNLLPQLRTRIQKWSSDQRIGDIMRHLAPFLKLYTEYVKEYSKCSAAVDKYEKSSSAFNAAIKQIRDAQDGRHGKLTIQAHMMEPIQRVPRYELLLRDYIKRIPSDSADKEDAVHYKVYPRLPYTLKI